jgi:hypothetical protein
MVEIQNGMEVAENDVCWMVFLRSGDEPWSFTLFTGADISHRFHVNKLLMKSMMVKQILEGYY